MSTLKSFDMPELTRKSDTNNNVGNDDEGYFEFD